MKLPILALGVFAILGPGPLEADAQTRPSPPKEEPGPGSVTQEGTGSSPTGRSPSIDQNRSVPSTTESQDNKSYGRETDAAGQALEQGKPRPSP